MAAWSHPSSVTATFRFFSGFELGKTVGVSRVLPAKNKKFEAMKFSSPFFIVSQEIRILDH